MDHATEPSPPIAPQKPVTLVAHGDVRIDEWAWLRDGDDPAVLDHLRAEQAYTEAIFGDRKALVDRLFDEVRGRIAETDRSVPVAKDGWWYYERTVEGLAYPIVCRAPRQPHEHHPPGQPHDGRSPDDAPLGRFEEPQPFAETKTQVITLPGEQVLLDQNALLEGGEHLAIGDLVVSPGHGLLAYSVDRSGDERFELHIRATVPDRTPWPRRVPTTDPGPERAGAGMPEPERTGTGMPETSGATASASSAGAVLVDEQIDGTSYGLAWADDHTLFYARPDAANRPYQLWRHEIGTPATADVLVYQEDDERFHLGVARAKDASHVLLELHSKVTSEIRALPCDQPTGIFDVVVRRRQGIECSVDHIHGTFVVVTNDGAENFRIMALDDAALGSPGAEDGAPPWRELVAGADGVRIEGVEVFEGHLVVYERRESSARIRVIPLAEDPRPLDRPLGEGWLVPCPDTPSTSWVGANPECATRWLRYEYSSLVTPRSIYDLDMETGEQVLLRRQPVLGGFDPSRYRSERLWATAGDATAVPVSVVRHIDTAVDGSAPCLLYGYGAYEHSVDPVFSATRLSLLDRGVVYAIAHVRGGGELGRRWYEEGKLLAKSTSCSDFVACADMLVRTGWSAPDRLVARGASAGGLLVGGAMNLSPDRFRAVVAEVPFVDCLTTMADDTLPLTVIEREEWGDPLADPAAYWAMRAYSPYDNVSPGHYPDVLATAGLHDQRVGYWEPAKWVQRLRQASPSSKTLLAVEMEAGHGGPSGRYNAWRDEARVLAFVLSAVGITS